MRQRVCECVCVCAVVCPDVVHRPVDGYRTGGMLGFAGGVGAGVLGLFAKPIAGFADVVSRGMQAVSHMASLDRDPEHGAFQFVSVIPAFPRFSLC